MILLTLYFYVASFHPTINQPCVFLKYQSIFFKYQIIFFKALKYLFKVFLRIIKE